MTTTENARQQVAEELFEAMRIPKSTPYHLRVRVKGWRPGQEFKTLCGWPSTKAIPVHPSDPICNTCLTKAQGLTDEEVNRRMHAAIGGMAPSEQAVFRDLAAGDQPRTPRGRAAASVAGRRLGVLIQPSRAGVTTRRKRAGA